MAYDAFRHEVVLFGGRGSSEASPGQALNDTWTFKGGHWTRRDPVIRPGPLAGAQMAYDARSHDCVLAWAGVGNGPAVTWTWNGSTWARTGDVPLAVDESFQSLAADPSSGDLLLISVADLTSGPRQLHTWTWDGRAWTLRQPAQQLPAGNGPTTLATIGTSPGDRLGHGVVAVVPIGSQGDTQTWVWNGSTWSQRTPAAASPPFNLDVTLAEDPATQQLLYIGAGDTVGGGNGPTWVWNGTTWHEAGPAPLIGNGATSALSDSASAHAIVFGDRTADSSSNQFDVLWTFNGQAWVSGDPA
jgi:hypothetical protein